MQRYHRNKPHIIQRMNGWATVLIVQSRLQAKLSWSIFFENLRNTLASSMQISLWGEPVGPLPCIDLTPVPRHAALDTWLTAQLLPSVCCSIDVHPAVMLRASRWVDVEVKVAEPTQFAQRNHAHTHTHSALTVNHPTRETLCRKHEECYVAKSMWTWLLAYFFFCKES